MTEEEKGSLQNDDVELELSEEGEGEAGAKARIEKLRKKLDDCEAERKEYLDGWQRAKADYANARRQEEEGRMRARSIAEEAVFRELIPILDSFDLAMSDPRWRSVDDGWRAGVEQIYNQLHRLLVAYEVTAIRPTGERFDPEKHHAVDLVPVDDPAKDHIVTDVLQRGYIRKDQVIRPAQVKVGRYQESTNNK